MTDCGNPPEFLQGQMNRKCIQNVVHGHTTSAEDMITALQFVDRLAIAFDLRLSNRAVLTRTGIAEYKLAFCPDGEVDNIDDADSVQKVSAQVFDMYEKAPVTPLDVLDTPLSKYCNTVRKTPESNEQ